MLRVTAGGCGLGTTLTGGFDSRACTGGAGLGGLRRHGLDVGELAAVDRGRRVDRRERFLERGFLGGAGCATAGCGGRNSSDVGGSIEAGSGSSSA